MNKYLFSLLILGYVCSFVACSEEEEVHPKVETLSAVAESASTINAEAKVALWGSIEVLEYGFVISQSNNLTSNLKHYQIGNTATQDKFSGTFSISEITQHYYITQLYVWSYITNAKGTVYGNHIEVTIPQLQLDSFSPSYGKAGDTVKIYGSNFSSIAGENKVFFNQTEAEIKSFSNTELMVEVPRNISYSYSYNHPRIRVIVGTREEMFDSEFTIIPSITSFEPKSGTINTLVTFYGDNIRNNYYYSDNIKINFGGTITNVNSVSNGVIEARIPREIDKINIPVSVIMYGHTQQLNDQFTILAPEITSIAPTKGVPGNEVYLYGNNFVDNDHYYQPHYYQVFFNDLPANNFNSNDNTINVTVPHGLDPGLYTIIVKSSLHEFTADQQFEIPSPEIISITPQKGAAGTYVRITGKYLADNCQIIFPDVAPIDVNNWQSDILEFNIPSGLPTGEIELSVKSGNTVINSPIKFFNEGVKISSFSPIQGKGGTLVTILGTGFNYPIVNFNDVQANVISHNYGKIVVSVPYMEAGNVKIAVRSYDEINIADQDFKILE